MAALCSRAGHIYFHSVVSSSFFFFSSPNLSGRRLHVYHTSRHGLSANLECRSEMCCMRLAGNTGRKNDAKNRHLGTISQLCRAVFATKARIDNLKTLVKQLYLLHTSLKYGEVRPTGGFGRFVSLGHPCKFQRVSRLGSVTARHCSSGRRPNCGVEQRAPPIFGRAAITLGIGPHSSFI